MNNIECEEGGLNIGNLWKLKKKLCPYKKDPPTAMMDPHGNLVTSEKSLKVNTMDHYKKVLANRPIKAGLEDFKEAKEELCEARIQSAKLNKSKPWTKEELNVASEKEQVKRSQRPLQ